VEAVFSYAGRTASPIAQPLPVRIGGFGGVEGLADYLREQGITHLVDTTHPFAAQISANAVAACAQTGTALMALEREAWAPQEDDDWRIVPDLEAAVAALPSDPARVFLAIGRQIWTPSPGCPITICCALSIPRLSPCRAPAWWWIVAPSPWRAIWR
jgi:precorrin-6A/cobalt-precorrin-6A reductase